LGDGYGELSCERKEVSIEDLGMKKRGFGRSECDR